MASPFIHVRTSVIRRLRTFTRWQSCWRQRPASSSMLKAIPSQSLWTSCARQSLHNGSELEEYGQILLHSEYSGGFNRSRPQRRRAADGAIQCGAGVPTSIERKSYAGSAKLREMSKRNIRTILLRV